MNILINSFSDDCTIDFVDRVTTTLEVEKCFWITDFWNAKGNNSKIKVLDRVSCSDLNHFFNYAPLLPLSKSLIEDLFETESYYLKILDRLLPYKGALDYQDRKQLYLKQIQFWNHFLQTEQIDVFISSNLPHEGYDFIIAALAQRMDIPTFSFFQLRQDFVLLSPNYKQLAIDLKVQIVQNKSREISKSELSEGLQYVYDTYYGTADQTPFYMKKNVRKEEQSIKRQKQNRRLLQKKRNWSDYLTITKMSELYTQFSGKISAKIKTKLLDFQYSKLETTPDLSQPYIYLALHYQPEMTTAPLAEVFVDQMLMLDILAAAAQKLNWQVLVKEHPTQKIHGRSLSYYQRLHQYEQVHLVPKSFSSEQLIQHCKAVATATGTVGWEAIFKHKPVLHFGNAYYEGAQGAFRIDDLEQCTKALDAINTGAVKMNQQSSLALLKAIDKVCFLANTSDYYMRNTQFTTPELSLNNLVDTAIKAIQTTLTVQQH